MNKRSLIKFKYGDNKGLFHYVIFEGEVVVLSEVNTRKIAFVEKNGTLEITFDIDSNIYDEVEVELVKDLGYVKKVYNYMIETNNAYFADGYEDLCVLKFHK